VYFLLTILFLFKMSFEITGKLYKKFATENKSATFQTREFVLEIMDGNYPQLIKFQMVQERCQILDTFNEGEEIKVHFDLRGREWQGKFLTNLNCWRVENGTANGATQPIARAAAPTASTTTSAPNYDDSFPSLSDVPLAQDDKDDLPF
jgi:single-strand DNA-binding protein